MNAEKKRKKKRVSTKVYAAKRMVEPQTVIKRLCETGSYFGDIPEKLPNGRWSWLDDEDEE